MTPRGEIIADLRTRLDGRWSFYGHADLPESIKQRAVVVYLTDVAPMPGAQAGAWRLDFELWALTGVTDPAKADDALDEVLTDVLAAVHGSPLLVWTEAQRASLAERFQGYQIKAWAVVPAPTAVKDDLTTEPDPETEE